MKHPELVRGSGKLGRIALAGVAIFALIGGGAHSAQASEPYGSVATATTTFTAPNVERANAKPAIANGPIVKTVSAGCSAGRCTVYLSKAETAALGRGAVPAPPSFVTGALRTAYYALAYGHRWFASQYASWGWCSGFRLSIYPWEPQGYFGYRC